MKNKMLKINTYENNNNETNEKKNENHGINHE